MGGGTAPLGDGSAEEFTLPAHPSLRTTAADRRHAATIARHIRAAGWHPTPTIVLRLALAKAAKELDPPTIPDEVAARMFPPSRHR